MRSRAVVVAAAFPVLAAISSCGGSSSPAGPAAPTASAPAGPAVITITSNNASRSFAPNPATFAGLMVVFRNSDTIVHRVRLNDGSLDTGDIAPGATSQPILMPAVGTNYHCSLHPTMIGAVSPEGAPPPVCSGLYC